MSENTDATPKTTPKQRKPRKDVPLSNVVQTIASKRDADATKIGKQVRSYIRGHDADLRKAFKWPPTDKQRADGNRYPPMPSKCADGLIAHFTRSKS